MNSRPADKQLVTGTALAAVLAFAIWMTGCIGLATKGAVSNAGVTSVTVSPSSASPTLVAKIQFAATVQGTMSNAAVTWSASVGSITPSGLYTAPSSPSTGVVTATSIADPTKSATATVKVTSAPASATVSSVTISPASAASITKGTLPFTATVEGTTSNKTVTWEASSGSITSSGNYTAPTSPGTATVTVRSNADPTKSASASVKIIAASGPPPPTPAPAPSPNTLSPAFFSLTVNSVNDSHYPSVPFGGLRLWDTGTTWKDLETSNNVYDWTPLDTWLRRAGNHDVLYTFGKTPQWASLRPNEGCGVSGNIGCAAPPADVDAGDAIFKAFVTALVKHSLGSASHIQYYEIWNEPNGFKYWTGTPAQLATMGKDAYTIIHSLDPAALVIGPGVSNPLAIGSGLKFLQSYYDAGAAASQDIVGMHAYLHDTNVEPTAMPSAIDAVRALMVSNGLASKPLFFTEGSWGDGSTAGPPGITSEQQVAYLAQQYLFMWSGKVDRYYWYAWDSHTWGPLTDANGIRPAGTAYNLLYNWLVGSVSPASPCSQAADATWSCALTLANGQPAEIVWNPNTSKLLPVGSTFTIFETLDNNIINFIPGNAVEIGNKPILLSR